MKKSILLVLLLSVTCLNAQTFSGRSFTQYLSLSFPDANVGWAVGYQGGPIGSSGVIDKTTDGGYTWTRQYSGAHHSEKSAVHFFDTLTGYVLGEGGILMKSTDGGLSWDEISTGIANYLGSMYWLDQNTGWLLSIRPQRSVLKTTDGGLSWENISLGAPYEPTRIRFINSTTGWVVGGGGEMFKSTDGGSTWSARSSGVGPPNNLWDISFPNDSIGWAVGGDYDTNSVIIKTTDGGDTWVEQQSPANRLLMGVEFLTTNFGWAVGWGGNVLMTPDGGENWTAEENPKVFTYSEDFRDIEFFQVSPSEHLAWICGSGYSIYASNSLITGINEPGTTPRQFSIGQNYPNPFNPSTTIEYTIDRLSDIEINIYNLNGQIVRTVPMGVQHPGRYSISWDGRDTKGMAVTSGSYYYQIKSENTQLTRKMLLIR